VTTLLILGGNPAYDAPGNLPAGGSFAEALGKVGTSIHLSLYRNETSRACTWHLPRAHALEAWDIFRNPDGSLAAAQPLIEPLYGGRTPAELLSLLLEQPARKAHDLARRTFSQATGGRGDAPADDPDFEARWQAFLRAGWLAGSAASEAPARFRSPLVGPNLTKGLQELQELGRVRLDRDNLELVFAPDGKVLDGRFANNAWLQELPDFLTKLTWDNAALLSPATAAALGVAQGDVVRLQWEGRQAELPVYVLPGQAAWSVTVSLGYGRTAAGRVGDGVGVDVNGLRHGLKFWGGPGLRLTRSGRTHTLVCTQDHHAIDTLGADERRQRIGHLVREADLAEYREHPDFAAHRGPHHPPLLSLWQERGSEGHRWGMAIDLNSCIGCNACVVACQAENNIPVVGKKQVGKGREMQWLRLDRYFRGDAENPQVAHQPVACVQCENAPCEQVCPVAATVHSEEGLNVMVYNRCVGTRYCSNNCPYKVRRFNFFNYQKHLTETQKMAYNPEVTVRSRGVMEKCTYCVQRIQKAKIRAKNERRILGDGEIVPACAQTCPTQAIVFGDLNDPESRVAGLQAEQRAYRMLAELNVKPRTAYLARVRNPNPELSTAAGEQAGGDAGHH
jgi:Fe-S-cluster-containing dehydrogenase component